MQKTVIFSFVKGEVVGRRSDLDDTDKINWVVFEDILQQCIQQQFGELLFQLALVA